MPKLPTRILRFQSATATAGNAAAVTFAGKSGKRFRILSINASSVGGTGSTPLTITGLENDPLFPSGGPQSFNVDLQVGIIGTPNVSGLVGEEDTDLVVTVVGLATSVPKLNVAAIEEPFNA